MAEATAEKESAIDTLPSCTVATYGDRSISLQSFMRHLHQRRSLVTLLGEATLKELLVQAAAEAQLKVDDDDLQNAANTFRYGLGLTTAKQMHAWLAQERLSIKDFEAELERRLLITKLKQHVVKDQISQHFERHRDDCSRVRLRQILVAREDLALELLTQIREEGRDFSDLAKTRSIHVSQSTGGLLGTVQRRQLPKAISDVVFAAKPGDVVGPLATSQGFHLFLIEELLPTQLDAETEAFIRDHLFHKWLEELLKKVPITFPLLDML